MDIKFFCAELWTTLLGISLYNPLCDIFREYLYKLTVMDLQQAMANSAGSGIGDTLAYKVVRGLINTSLGMKEELNISMDGDYRRTNYLSISIMNNRCTYCTFQLYIGNESSFKMLGKSLLLATLQKQLLAFEQENDRTLGEALGQDVLVNTVQKIIFGAVHFLNIVLASKINSFVWCSNFYYMIYCRNAAAHSYCRTATMGS